MRYQHFETPLGNCAIAWSDKGLTKVSLSAQPNGSDQNSVSMHEHGKSINRAPDWVDRAVQSLRACLQGEDVSLDGIQLDWTGVSAFYQNVYSSLRLVERGTTITYGELAHRVGRPGAARAIGVAMAKNKWPIVVPCHRVVATGDQIGGFSAPGGVDTKRRLLELEGFHLPSPVVRDLFE